MKFSIEEILKGTSSEISSSSSSEGSNSKQVPDELRTNGATQQNVETRQREAIYSATIEEYDLGENMQRRARTTIAKWQRHELERLFAKYRYPTLEKVEQLSEQLGLPQYVIKVWFQNRRAKYRKENRRRNRNLAFAEVMHTDFHRVPILPQFPIRVPPRIPPRIPTKFVFPKRCVDDARTETSTRTRYAQDNTQHTILQHSTHHPSYDERLPFHKHLDQDRNQSPTFNPDSYTDYKEKSKEYETRFVAFKTGAESCGKCCCRECEQN